MYHPVPDRTKLEGKAEPSFVSKQLNDLVETNDIKDQEEHIEDIKHAAAAIFIAGADTVAMHIFLFSFYAEPSCSLGGLLSCFL